MLALTRKAGRSVFIGPEITVKVLAIEATTVRLGFDAPDDYIIRRDELYGCELELTSARAEAEHARHHAVLLEALDYLINATPYRSHSRAGGALTAMRDAIAAGSTLSEYIEAQAPVRSVAA